MPVPNHLPAPDWSRPPTAAGEPIPPDVRAAYLSRMVSAEVARGGQVAYFADGVAVVHHPHRIQHVLHLLLEPDHDRALAADLGARDHRRGEPTTHRPPERGSVGDVHSPQQPPRLARTGVRTAVADAAFAAARPVAAPGPSAVRQSRAAQSSVRSVVAGPRRSHEEPLQPPSGHARGVLCCGLGADLANSQKPISAGQRP